MSKIKTGLGRGLDALINPKGIKNASEKAPDYSEVSKDDGRSVDVLARIPVNLILGIRNDKAFVSDKTYLMGLSVRF